MKIVVVSDCHDLSGFDAIYRILDFESPNVLLSCGDFGSNLPTQKRHVLAHYSPEFLRLTPGAYEDLFNPILDKTHFRTIFGNHDILDVLCTLRNRDGSICWLPDLVPLKLGEHLYVAGINGNFSKETRYPWNTTETKVLAAFKKMPRIPHIDIILSHEAVAGYDELGKGRPILRTICEKLKPKYWFCGHIHRRSIHFIEDTDTTVVNLDPALRGGYAVVEDGILSVCHIGKKVY